MNPKYAINVELLAYIKHPEGDILILPLSDSNYRLIAVAIFPASEIQVNIAAE